MNAPLPQNLKPIARQVTIVGKILDVQRRESTTYTVVLCPAEDEYSRPSEVKIRSARSVGRVGEVVDVLCKLGGYGRAFEYKDKETGEILRGRQVDMILDVVGA